jgi:hypothetical protein
MLVETIVAALVPAGIDVVKQLITRWTGGVQAVTIDEKIKLQEADNATLEALAKLDNPYGVPSQWIVDLRAGSRYISAIIVILVGLSTLYISLDTEIMRLALELVSITFGFLFGHRVNLNTGKK